MGRTGSESLNDEDLQTQLKTRLQSKIFIATFKAKGFCGPLKFYRDLVVIDTKSEKKISKELNKFLAELAPHLVPQVFVGITKSKKSLNLWTELDDDIAFGKYWFQVKTIKFRFNEVQIELKKLRSIDDDDVKTFSEKLRSAANEQSRDDATAKESSINRQTITEIFRIVSLVIVGSIKIVKYLGIFTIKLIERITWLVDVLTPIALALIEVCSKIIGGFLYLFAMIWKDSTGAVVSLANTAIEARHQRRPYEAIRYERYNAFDDF